MKKKEYEKPTTMVVKFEQQNHLLTLSNPDYVPGGDPLAGSREMDEF